MANEINVVWDPLLEFPGHEERQTLSRNGCCGEIYQGSVGRCGNKTRKLTCFGAISQVKHAGILKVIITSD